ncbi:MAG: M28 family peptidase [Verrucomicrobia bacterium]|nr:M28 family peptidase [Cytophagales bacterium]
MHKLLIIALLLVSATFSLLAQNDKELTDGTLSKSKIEAHLRFLASDELRGRNTPSPEQMIAARYLITQLQSYGVKALPQYPDYLQAVPMKTQTKPQEVSISYAGKNFKLAENTLLIDGNDTQTEAEAIFLNFGTAEDFKKADVKGKIVIVKAGAEKETNPRRYFALGNEKRTLARQKGAIALIELYNNAQLPWKLLVNYLNNDRMGLDEDAQSQQTLTHIWLHDPENKELGYFSQQKSTKIQFKIAGSNIKRFNTYNVVGFVAGKDTKLKEEFVVFSAHYDHIGIGEATNGDSIYNGARDNAVGTVTVLSAAENLGKYPAKRSGLFILFTGEEKGLLGSRWCVEHPPVPLKQMVYCFNSDNAGYNDTSVATIIGLGRTTAENSIKQACQIYGLTATDDPAPEQGLFDRSDNVNFAQKGVPAPTFSLGFKAFDEEIGKYYHQAADQADNLDYNYLYKFFGSYVYACRLIANLPEKPFWKPGDKYFEAGKNLYK